jgi:hypothetical protein
LTGRSDWFYKTKPCNARAKFGKQEQKKLLKNIMGAIPYRFAFHGLVLLVTRFFIGGFMLNPKPVNKKRNSAGACSFCFSFCLCYCFSLQNLFPFFYIPFSVTPRSLASFFSSGGGLFAAPFVGNALIVGGPAPQACDFTLALCAHGGKAPS